MLNILAQMPKVKILLNFAINTYSAGSLNLPDFSSLIPQRYRLNNFHLTLYWFLSPSWSGYVGVKLIFNKWNMHMVELIFLKKSNVKDYCSICELAKTTSLNKAKEPAPISLPSESLRFALVRSLLSPIFFLSSTRACLQVRPCLTLSAAKCVHIS